MANRVKCENRSWNMLKRMEVSSSEAFPRISSEEGMRYLEGVDWSEIWKTMIIQDDDVFDNGMEAEEEQSRTMMIMGDEYDDDDIGHEHSEDDERIDDERYEPRESGGCQKPQRDDYMAHVGGHRPTRSWSVIPEKYDEGRRQNNLRTRTRWTVIPQQYDERRVHNNPPTTRTHSSLNTQQYARQHDEWRGENKQPTRIHSPVVPQQYAQQYTQQNAPQYDESGGQNIRRTQTHSSVIPQQYFESPGKSIRPSRTHSSVIPQRFDESLAQNKLQTRARWSVIPQQFVEHGDENNLRTRARIHSTVTPQQYDESRLESRRPTRTSSSSIHRQYDESGRQNNLPTRTRWSVIPQLYDENRLENKRPTRTRSSVIQYQYDESHAHKSRSRSLQLARGRLNEMNWQRTDSTDTRARRNNSRGTEGGIGNNEQNFQRKQSSGLICNICYSEEVHELRNCCSFPICQSCFVKYLTTQIDEGKVRIDCPNYECRSAVPFEDIIQIVDADSRIKLERRATKTLRKKGFKACPQCNAITVASETLLRKARQEKSTFKVTCPVCELEWCYDCETPWHSKTTCKNVKSNDKLFKEWTKRYSDTERSEKNARKCPKCKVYIQKNTGCDHMTCRWCSTKFCYKCGRRIGSSPHRCYDFLPNLNTSKGTIFLMVLLAPLAIPAIVAVAAVSLPILIGYGGYKLVKAVRRRPTART